MNTSSEILTKIAQLKPVLQKDYNLSSIGVFGSVSGGKLNKNSDVDVLVEFSQPIMISHVSKKITKP
jgi:predicted nucleotidyltransferase